MLAYSFVPTVNSTTWLLGAIAAELQEQLQPSPSSEDWELATAAALSARELTGLLGYLHFAGS